LGYGFDNIGMERITTHTLEINVPCQKAFEKLGFVLEGRARKAFYFMGKRWDYLHYGLLVYEWKERQ
jgi:RimJ/RimL family protein N-acetyltransferase